MCGRFSLAEPEGIGERFAVGLPAQPLQPRYNIAPSQPVAAVINEAGVNYLKTFRWGLVPSWAKDAAIGYKLINARAETLEEKASFRALLQRKRCLIPADGFYEWKKTGRGKRPYRITLREGEMFGFAGLWDSWRSPTGETVNSCTIITTRANALVGAIHDRMPVILPREAETIWLDQALAYSPALKDLLVSFPAAMMRLYEVSPLVNSPANESRECIGGIQDAE
ncbi:putative SOS response-associated peptidase YedK [Peptococcaceae bacterium CEB3]|nr:putative SOS response-associated peptidase YedK [Peptococcaceae bacterium CEB3]